METELFDTSIMVFLQYGRRQYVSLLDTMYCNTASPSLNPEQFVLTSFSIYPYLGSSQRSEQNYSPLISFMLEDYPEAIYSTSLSIHHKHRMIRSVQYKKREMLYSVIRKCYLYYREILRLRSSTLNRQQDISGYTENVLTSDAQAVSRSNLIALRSYRSQLLRS